MSTPLVAVVMGSDSDWSVMSAATALPTEFDIAHEVQVVSAHRTPAAMIAFGLLFDLFNEPHGMSWDVWQHGGEPNRKEKTGEEDAFISPEDKAKILAARRSVGMQKLLQTVRDCGARNVVLVGGLDYAFDLSGMVNGHMLDDRWQWHHPLHPHLPVEERLGGKGARGRRETSHLRR